MSDDKRLAMLEQMVRTGNADSFARYALAMQYRKAGRTDEALAAFEALRDTDPDYLAQYLMAGQLLIEAQRPEEARPWLEQGLEVAAKAGDAKAKNELTLALDELD